MNEFGIVLCFDKHTESKIVALSKDLDSQESKEFRRPHITLAVVRGKSDFKLLQERVEDFTSYQKNIEVSISAVGLYPTGNSDVYLSLTNTLPLRTAHADLLHSIEPEFCAFESYHKPENWNPHCTVVYSAVEHELSKAVQVVRQSNVFGLTTLAELVLIDSQGVKPATYNLKS